jgi:hypothetical protein
MRRRSSSPARVARSPLAVLFALSVTATFGMLAACSSDGGGANGGFTCPSDLPTGCVGTPPSYASDVAPLLSRRCSSCHDPSGVAGNTPLDTYSHVHQSRSTILTRVYGCQMPPAGETPLNAAERAILLRWLVCEAPNN